MGRCRLVSMVYRLRRKLLAAGIHARKNGNLEAEVCSDSGFTVAAAEVVSVEAVLSTVTAFAGGFRFGIVPFLVEKDNRKLRSCGVYPFFRR